LKVKLVKYDETSTTIKVCQPSAEPGGTNLEELADLLVFFKFFSLYIFYILGYNYIFSLSQTAI